MGFRDLCRSAVVLIAMTFMLSSLAMLASASSAFGDTQIAAPGSEAGEVLEPSALAVDPSTGTLYVADRGNRRVDVFDSSGAFIRAFGWGVVASGPGNDPHNEIQQVGVAATGGSFTLLFVQNSEEIIDTVKQETGLLPFNATASSVQAALESLPAINPGDVAVSGPIGGPWTIEFKGFFADTDLHQLEEGGSSQLTGGAAKLEISTIKNGSSYEVCEPERGDVCRAGQRGVGAGQLNPTSIAVDPSTHAVYVFDGLESASHNEAFNNRVQKFTTEGEFLYMLGKGVDVDTGEDICTASSGDTCGRGEKGSGPGEFNAAFSSVAVGPGGVLHVNDGGRVQRFDPAGGLIDQVVLAEASPRYLAVDSGGSLYVTAVDSGQVRKYTSGGALLYSLPGSNVGAIAVDGDDRLYVTDLNSGRFGISRYSSTGSPEVVFYSEARVRATAVAPNKEATDVFTVEDGSINSVPLSPPGPVVYPDPATVFADGITNVKAILHSEVNPEGKATTFHYEYVEQGAFEAEGWASTEVMETGESGSLGSDFLLHPAAAEITGLTPETEYRFRVIASNADAPAGVLGPEGTFVTEPPVKFGPLWVTEISTSTATLHAEINPFGFAATGYFEYVDDATYDQSGFSTAEKAPAGSSVLDFGDGEEFVERSVDLAELDPGTTYHYRLVVSNHCKPAEPSVVCTFSGAEKTLTTFADLSPPLCEANEDFRDEVARLLLDCREYEMVSPVDKNGVNVETVFNNAGYPAALNQSSRAGNSISYSAYRAFADPESAPYTSQYLAERTGKGWLTESISPPREGPSLYNVAGLDNQFKAFTEDLCSGWPLQDTAGPLLAPGAIEGFPNLYRRSNCAPEAGSYETITSATPIGAGPEPKEFFPELQGMSADGDKTFFAVKAKLTAKSREGKVQAYVSSGGTLEPVCVLPEGNVTLSGCSIGTNSVFGERNSSMDTAVSEDGSIVYWTNKPSGNGPLYVRVDGQETVLVTAQESQFWAASADGAHAVYTTGETLYEFDRTGETSSLIAEGVKGLAGASEDLSRVYLVSTKALTGDATAGQPNLYRYAAGGFHLIGALADSDMPPPTNRASPVSTRPLLRLSRVSPDGERLVFMSKAELTDYDNIDAETGEPISEVFLYDASANGGQGRLLCLSCNPSGARPLGQDWVIGGIAAGRVAAFIPGWTNQLYAPRVMSDDGSRVFFNSFDPLVARDANQEADVYQWEAPGSGNCQVDGYAYVPEANGCVNLISSGGNTEGSELVDSSASGEDVFFKTYESLYAGDPGLIDIYDARVGGGFPDPPVLTPECEGEGCSGPQAPEPAHFTPQSNTFVGPGNPVAKSTRPKKCPKGKHRVKRKGKIVCVRHKKHRSGNKGKGTSR